MPPILFKVQAMLNQGSASIGIVSDSIAMDDGIDQGQGKKEEQKENTLERDSTLRRLWVRFQRKMNAPSPPNWTTGCPRKTIQS